jgi:hypothetical protein
MYSRAPGIWSERCSDVLTEISSRKLPIGLQPITQGNDVVCHHNVTQHETVLTNHLDLTCEAEISISTPEQRLYLS